MSGIVRANNAGQSGAVSNIETIDSDDYVDASIDTAHIANDQVTGAKLNPSLVLGDIIYATGTDAIGRLAKGSEDEVLTMGDSNAPTWAAASSGSSGSVTREGGQLTEATTTSTSVVDVLTAASLTIAAIQPFEYRNLFRKTSGAGSPGGAGLKLNATVIATPTVDANGAINVSGKSSATNEAQNGFPKVYMASTVTNYAFAVIEGTGAIWAAGGVVRNGGAFTRGDAAARPTAQITDVVLNAISSTSVTVGLDELHVYSLATS